jgi:hypothetical protein
MIRAFKLIEFNVSLRKVVEMDFFKFLLGGFKVNNPHRKVVDHFK